MTVSIDYAKYSSKIIELDDNREYYDAVDFQSSIAEVLADIIIEIEVMQKMRVSLDYVKYSGKIMKLLNRRDKFEPVDFQRAIAEFLEAIISDEKERRKMESDNGL